MDRSESYDSRGRELASSCSYLLLNSTAQKALHFPDIHGTALAGSEDKVHTTNLLQGKVSVVALLTTRISEVCRVCLRGGGCSQPGFADTNCTVCGAHATSVRVEPTFPICAGQFTRQPAQVVPRLPLCLWYPKNSA